VPPSVTISAVGDCTLGSQSRTFEQELARHGDKLRYPFSGVRAELERDDLTIANLETPLTNRPRRGRRKVEFRGKPQWAQMLALGSVEIVNTANNHSHDCGGRGFDDTLAALEAAQVRAFGREQIDRHEVNGIEVINIGYPGGHRDAVRSLVRRAIRENKRDDNLVIVSFHWGGEEVPKPTPTQYELGRDAISTGADLVLGHHPHVIQGMERYRGKRIVYSLGNFVFGGDSEPADMDAIIYRATFELRDGRVMERSERVIPVSISSSAKRNDYRPRILEGAEHDRVLGKLQARSDQLKPQ